MATLGEPIDRIDGRLKVTGAARYAADFPVPGLVHAVLVERPSAWDKSPVSIWLQRKRCPA